MKLTDLKTLAEVSSKAVNAGILNHNLKTTFGETSDEVQNNPYEGNTKKIDHTAKKKPPKSKRAGDRLVFSEAKKHANVGREEFNKHLSNLDKEEKAEELLKKKAKKLKEASYESDDELELPNDSKPSRVVISKPSMFIKYEGRDGKEKNILKGQYSDLNALKRIFKNFFNLVLSSEIEDELPKVLKYSDNSLLASVNDKNGGEYLIRLSGLSNFEEVKAFNRFLKQELVG